jgi:hypothetical protein
LPAAPCHTTVRTGPYTAVREVTPFVVLRLTPPARCVISRIRRLNRSGPGRNHALDLQTGAEAEPEKLLSLRSRHSALRLIHLELEPLRDELRNALHHPLTRPLAANVGITIVRASNVTMSPALLLPVEFVEHEIA